MNRPNGRHRGWGEDLICKAFIDLFFKERVPRRGKEGDVRGLCMILRKQKTEKRLVTDTTDESEAVSAPVYTPHTSSVVPDSPTQPAQIRTGVVGPDGGAAPLRAPSVLLVVVPLHVLVVDKPIRTRKRSLLADRDGLLHKEVLTLYLCRHRLSGPRTSVTGTPYSFMVDRTRNFTLRTHLLQFFFQEERLFMNYRYVNLVGNEKGSLCTNISPIVGFNNETLPSSRNVSRLWSVTNKTTLNSTGPC